MIPMTSSRESSTMSRIVYLSRGGNIGGSQRQLLYLVTGLANTYEPVVICTAVWRHGHAVAVRRGADGGAVPCGRGGNCPAESSGTGTPSGSSVRSSVMLRSWSIVPTCGWATTRRWLKWRLRALTGRFHVPGAPRVLGRAQTPTSSGDRLDFHFHTNHTYIEACPHIRRQNRPDRGWCGHRTGSDRLRAPPSAPLTDARRSKRVVNIGLVGRIEPAKRQLEFVETGV